MADQIIQHNEKMVGANHGTLDDTLNRLTLVEHNTDGTHVDDSITLAKMAPGTDGNLITYDVNGDPAYVATGNATQVLTSNGAGAVPTMQDATSSSAVGLFEIDVNGGLMPVTDNLSDNYYELDGNDDIMPQVV